MTKLSTVLNMEKTTTSKKLYMIGQYELAGKILGKGNFAKVHLGIHKLLNEKVAVKVIDIEKAKEEYVAKNLDREARIMAMLSHPNIVYMYEALQRDHMYYLVMEYAGGGDLCNYIKMKEEKKLKEGTARRFGRQLISAMVHMHEHGIIHRDIKMENIMLNHNKTQIKLVDFGLSNIWSENSPLKTHCGSPEYAAPELFIEGKTYGPEIDLWSLGVILYAMTMGQLPFISPKGEGLSRQEKRQHLLVQINQGLSSDQRKALNSISPEFQNLVERLLTPETGERIQMSQVMVHPWVTRKNRTPLNLQMRTALHKDVKSECIQKIALLLQLDCRSVREEIKSKKFGHASGMFRILMNSYWNNQHEISSSSSSNCEHDKQTPTKDANAEKDKTNTPSRKARPKSKTCDEEVKGAVARADVIPESKVKRNAKVTKIKSNEGLPVKIECADSVNRPKTAPEGSKKLAKYPSVSRLASANSKKVNSTAKMSSKEEDKQSQKMTVKNHVENFKRSLFMQTCKKKVAEGSQSVPTQAGKIYSQHRYIHAEKSDSSVESKKLSPTVFLRHEEVRSVPRNAPRLQAEEVAPRRAVDAAITWSSASRPHGYDTGSKMHMKPRAVLTSLTPFYRGANTACGLQNGTTSSNPSMKNETTRRNILHRAKSAPCACNVQYILQPKKVEQYAGDMNRAHQRITSPRPTVGERQLEIFQSKLCQGDMLRRTDDCRYSAYASTRCGRENGRQLTYSEIEGRKKAFHLCMGEHATGRIPQEDRAFGETSYAAQSKAQESGVPQAITLIKGGRASSAFTPTNSVMARKALTPHTIVTDLPRYARTPQQLPASPQRIKPKWLGDTLPSKPVIYISPNRRIRQPVEDVVTIDMGARRHEKN